MINALTWLRRGFNVAALVACLVFAWVADPSPVANLVVSVVVVTAVIVVGTGVRWAQARIEHRGLQFIPGIAHLRVGDLVEMVEETPAGTTIVTRGKITAAVNDRICPSWTIGNDDAQIPLLLHQCERITVTVLAHADPEPVER